MLKYHINIFFSDEDGGYIADVPDLRYSSAFGETPEKALAEVKQAMVLWLETARDSGKDAPEPSYRPEIYQKA